MCLVVMDKYMCPGSHRAYRGVGMLWSWGGKPSDVAVGYETRLLEELYIE